MDKWKTVQTLLKHEKAIKAGLWGLGVYCILSTVGLVVLATMLGRRGKGAEKTDKKNVSDNNAKKIKENGASANGDYISAGGHGQAPVQTEVQAQQQLLLRAPSDVVPLVLTPSTGTNGSATVII